MKRKIVKIDQELCNGCGDCVGSCHEGAIQMVDGKAQLVSDVYCDGLGDCLGECPTGAITIEEREAEAFDPAAVARRQRDVSSLSSGGGCPGMRSLSFGSDSDDGSSVSDAAGSRGPNRLRQWPLQLSLVPVEAPWWDDADVLLIADCVALALGDVQDRLVGGRRLAMACPKLDDTSSYVDKLAAILSANRIRTLTVARMHVPCCSGLVRIAEEAVARSGCDLELNVVVVDHEGNLLS